MSLNWKEIDLILQELQLEGSHVRKIYQPDYGSLVFDLFRPGDAFQLLISLKPGSCRLHRFSAKTEKKVGNPRFAQFLKSRIQGGRISSAEQIDSERIIRVEISRGGETTILYIRLWSNAANIIAVDEFDTILDAFYRRPGRGETSGERYSPQQDIGDGTAKKRAAKKRDFSVRDYPESTDFNTAIEREYGKKERDRECEQLLEELQRVFRQKQRKITDTIASLRSRLETYEDRERYKHYGDLIMSNLHQIQKGQKWLKTENFYNENEEVHIELDPLLSPSENAERYYGRFKKAKSGLGKLRDEIKSLQNESEQLKEAYEDLCRNGEPDHIRSFIRRNKPKKKQHKKDDGIPGLQFSSHGFTLLVGRNARENDALLRRHTRGNDYWLHSRDYPGAYVFIRNKAGKSVPLDVLLDAGNLALHYSKAKTEGGGELYYTQVKYLRRVKDGKTGLVIPTQEKNLSVDIEKERLEQLKTGGG